VFAFEHLSAARHCFELQRDDDEHTVPREGRPRGAMSLARPLACRRLRDAAITDSLDRPDAPAARGALAPRRLGGVGALRRLAQQ
jgi:hypothetical protein